MTDFQISPSSLRRGAGQLEQASESLQQAAKQFMAQVSDAAPLGGNDILGSVAMPIYQGMYEHLAHCLPTVIDALGGHAEQLSGAADDYEAIEEFNVSLADQITGSL